MVGQTAERCSTMTIPPVPPPPPSSNEALIELRSVVKALNDATDTLNETIEGFEATLKALAPGISVWCLPPLRIVRSMGIHGTASQLGFSKYGDDWRLMVRRGMFTNQPSGWTPVE